MHILEKYPNNQSGHQCLYVFSVLMHQKGCMKKSQMVYGLCFLKTHHAKSGSDGVNSLHSSSCGAVFGMCD